VVVGLQDGSDAKIETLKAIEYPISKRAQILVEACSFAGTGNVLRVQAMLHHCDEHVQNDKEKEKEKEENKNDKDKEEKKDEPKIDDTFQVFAVLGITLITMGKDIGAEMLMRQFNHLVSHIIFMENAPLIPISQMHYGDSIIRKTVPLALGLVSTSNPVLPILDTLSKYSHDNDLAVALNAIFAMHFVGAGTNNTRLAQMLRQLAGYYYKEPDCHMRIRHRVYSVPGPNSLWHHDGQHGKFFNFVQVHMQRLIVFFRSGGQRVSKSWVQSSQCGFEW